jgi:DNA-directed RNA polymerase, mitochondrial
LEIQKEADELALTKNVRFEQDVSEPSLSAADIMDGKNTDDPDLDLLAALEATDEEDGEMDDVDTRLMAGKFVNLTDLLPPVPAKGNFKVEAIKGSQYFFS